MTMSGGCFCGAIRYQCDDEVFNATTCHCPSCRRTSGAAAVAWFSVPASGFHLTSGEPAELRSSPEVTRTFCRSCGTQLTYQHANYPDEIDVTICSLDDPGSVAPDDHTQTSHRLDWNLIADGKPQYPRSRSEGQA